MKKVLGQAKRPNWMNMTYSGMEYDHTRPEDYPVPVKKKGKLDIFKTVLFKWFW